MNRLGRAFFLAAITAFGVLQLLFLANLAPAPSPPWNTDTRGVVVVTGLALLAASLAIAFTRKARQAATLLALLFFLRVLLFYAPALLVNPKSPGPWTSGAEVFAFCGAALVLAKHARAGAIVFALALVVFGVQHLMYADFIAGLIPPWIPARVFFTDLVGAAFLAAALAILSRVQLRLASALLGLMFALWVLGLHLPRILVAPHNGAELTSGLVALAMAGAAWLL